MQGESRCKEGGQGRTISCSSTGSETAVLPASRRTSNTRELARDKNDLIISNSLLALYHQVPHVAKVIV